LLIDPRRAFTRAEGRTDLQITQQIRKALVADERPRGPIKVLVKRIVATLDPNHPPPHRQ
jgi:hypothetical protein